MKKLFLSVLVIIGFSAISFAQTATATASGTIKAGMTIANSSDMNFGIIIGNAVSGGTVAIDPATSNRNITGSLLLAGGTVSTADFTLTGTLNAPYAITLPTGNYTVTRALGTETMIINGFSCDAPSGLLAGTTKTIKVGATLTVGTTTVNPAGVYTNSTGFTVTAVYQ